MTRKKENKRKSMELFICLLPISVDLVADNPTTDVYMSIYINQKSSTKQNKHNGG